ncbi:MAG TPA: LLM class F420-dependent oxidoreductase [Candidatus Binataceae bacterium]|nr:LLM class F420-dependent oxidoreductase [Candidatus Binataceae bacterium]
MKFATFLYQIAGPDIARVARRAEELGFESLWIPEHLVLPVEYRSPYPYSADGRMPAPPDTPLHDPFLALAYAAAVTSRIRLATGVFVVPLRNPFATAKAVASLDVLSGGRFIFGVGIGWLEEEFDTVGMTFGDRARRTREYLALMRELWTRNDPVFEGRTVRVAGCKFMPKPIQQPRPPVIFGGHTEPSLRRAAQVADGWYGIAENIADTRDLIARLRGHERAQNRTSPLEITLSPRLGGPLTVAQVQTFAEMGVARLITPVGREPERAVRAMEQFHEQVMSRV